MCLKTKLCWGRMIFGINLQDKDLVHAIFFSENVLVYGIFWKKHTSLAKCSNLALVSGRLQTSNAASTKMPIVKKRNRCLKAEKMSL